MNLFHTYGRRAPNRVFLSILLGIGSGLGYALLIPIVLNALAPEPAGLHPAAHVQYTLAGFEIAHAGFAALFLGVCLFVLATRTLSRALLIRLSMEMTSSLRLQLARKIAAAPYAELERMGTARLHTVLTEDVRRIVVGGQLLPDILINLITLLGLLAFLLYLNAPAFRFVIGAIVVGALSYQVPVYFARRMMLRARGQLDKLHDALRGLIYGIKELKLDGAKRSYYFEQVLQPREQDVLRQEQRASTVMIAGASYGDMLSFVVIGVTAFVFVNYHAIKPADLTGLIMALLYLSGPVAAIMNAIPQALMAKASLANVERLLSALSLEAAPACAPCPPWQRMQLRQVSYQHRERKGGEGFGVGPLNLTLERGSINFLVGGNGSGKSTLSKLVSMHYLPTSGGITVDDCMVGDANRDSFRSGIAVIFTDYHLFDRILAPLDAQQHARAEALLAELGLSDKVQLVDGVFSTLALSDGQRKRLALLVALLEDKALYVFDEWAADQDPQFRKVFYHKILPDLRARGKAVLAITHDDAYFDVADHLHVMEYGTLRTLKPSLRASA